MLCFCLSVASFEWRVCPPIRSRRISTTKLRNQRFTSEIFAPAGPPVVPPRWIAFTSIPQILSHNFTPHCSRHYRLRNSLVPKTQNNILLTIFHHGEFAFAVFHSKISAWSMVDPRWCAHFLAYSHLLSRLDTGLFPWGYVDTNDRQWSRHLFDFW